MRPGCDDEGACDCGYLDDVMREGYQRDYSTPPPDERCPMCDNRGNPFPGGCMDCGRLRPDTPKSAEPAAAEVQRWWLDKSDGKFYEPGTDGVDDYIEVIEKSAYDAQVAGHVKTLKELEKVIEQRDRYKKQLQDNEWKVEAQLQKEIAKLKASTAGERALNEEKCRCFYDRAIKAETERDELGGLLSIANTAHANDVKKLRRELEEAAVERETLLALVDEWKRADHNLNMSSSRQIALDAEEKCEQYKAIAAQLAAACTRNPSSGSCIEALKEYNKLMETKK